MKVEYENLNKLNIKFRREFADTFDKFLLNNKFILGENVENFEKEFSSYCGENVLSVGVSSGLDALILSIEVLSLPKESEIIVPSNTYIATIISIIRLGYKPVLVEPCIIKYNIDVNILESYITKKTKVIMCVHLYGKMCDMDDLLNLCKKYDLYLIEDSSQSHGSEYKNKRSGTFGDLSAFSLYPTKNLGALGDAGIITTKNENFYDKLLYLRNYGSKIKYQNDYIGYNSRLDEIQAGFLLTKLKYLNEIISHKRFLADLYIKNINSKFILPLVEHDKKDSYHIFNIRVDNRNELKNYLESYGIQTEIHYPISPHNQKCLKDYNFGYYPISDEIHNTTLSLPISYIHSEEDIYYVIKTLNKF